MLVVSFAFAALYISFGDQIMAYGKDDGNPLMLRFLPVLAIQFGMSCLGPGIVMLKNHERFSDYCLMSENCIKAILLSLLFAVPTMVFLLAFGELHSFLPFQGMFLTREILHGAFPLNGALYLVIALVWGFGEGFFYVVLSQKINALIPPKRFWNVGAFVCAVIAVLIHGMIGTDLKTVLEALATFVLMYGAVCVKDAFRNSWGLIAVFFVVWNAF